MTTAKYDLVSIGNALVDILSHVDDDFLSSQVESHGIAKGTMALIDTQRAEELYKALPQTLMASGGSAANTMAGFAALGGTGAFMGKVANDELGAAFTRDMDALGLTHSTAPLENADPTGRCMVLITPDAQRTMNTFLGASIEFGESDVDTDLIKNANITYLEGYLYDKDKAKSAFKLAAKTAHEAGRKIALSLSDPFCVDRHRDDFLDLVEHHIDILFANEDEIKSLYQEDTFESAAAKVSTHVDIAVLTRGEHGAHIRKGAEAVSVPAFPVPSVEDTTGAGDQFAAGFLYGLTQRHNMETCAKLGALAAAEVISHTGPRPEKDIKAMAAAEGLISA